MRHFDSCPAGSGTADLLLQANKLCEQRALNAQAVAALRPLLVDALDDALMALDRPVTFSPAIGLTLFRGNLGDEPTAELGYSEIGAATFSDETGQTLLAEDGLEDEDGNPAFDHSTDELDIFGLADLLARLTAE